MTRPVQRRHRVHKCHELVQLPHTLPRRHALLIGSRDTERVVVRRVMRPCGLLTGRDPYRRHELVQLSYTLPRLLSLLRRNALLVVGKTYGAQRGPSNCMSQ